MLQSSRLSSRFKKKRENKYFADDSVKVDEITDTLASDSSMQDVKVSLDEMEEVYKNLLLNKIESIPVWKDYSIEKQRELISAFVMAKLASDMTKLSEQEKSVLIDKLCDFVTGLGPLDYLIKQDNVDAVYVNGLNTVHIEISSKILNTEIKLTQNQLDIILKNIFSLSNRQYDKDEFVRNFKYDNLLISVIMPPVSQGGVNIVIKKLKPELLQLNTLINGGFITEDLFEFLISVVNSGKNIVVSGDAGCGKTLLIDALTKLALSNKRGVILEEFSQIQATSDTLMKFDFSSIKSDYEFRKLFSNLNRLSPDFVVNLLISAIERECSNIISLRSSNIDNVISKITGAYICEEKCSEKYAKLKFLSTFDYVVQIGKCSDGIRRITSITELSPARTMALSLKNIAKWENNAYVLDIPQPFTSIKASSLLPGNNYGKIPSMKARFYRQEN